MFSICTHIYTYIHTYVHTHIENYILSFVTFACYQQFRTQIVLACESGSHVPNLLSSKQTHYIHTYVRV